jgi:hypothetical protein
MSSNTVYSLASDTFLREMLGLYHAKLAHFYSLPPYNGNILHDYITHHAKRLANTSVVAQTDVPVELPVRNVESPIVSAVKSDIQRHVNYEFSKIEVKVFYRELSLYLNSLRGAFPHMYDEITEFQRKRLPIPFDTAFHS